MNEWPPHNAKEMIDRWWKFGSPPIPLEKSRPGYTITSLYRFFTSPCQRPADWTPEHIAEIQGFLTLNPDHMHHSPKGVPGINFSRGDKLTIISGKYAGYWATHNGNIHQECVDFPGERSDGFSLTIFDGEKDRWVMVRWDQVVAGWVEVTARQPAKSAS